MSRKPKKGYYVRGVFVAEGSELDLELKRELRGDQDTSKSEAKRESTELQKLGEDLLTLRPALLQRLQLPEKLSDALAELRRITDFEGRRRQSQFVGKLMRRLDDSTVEAVRAALAEQRHGAAGETLALHQAEQWRERLIAEPDAQEQWLRAYPATDAQQLRALVRQARKDAQPEKPGAAPRHGRAYREIFQLVRDQLSGSATAAPPEADDPHAGAAVDGLR